MFRNMNHKVHIERSRERGWVGEIERGESENERERERGKKRNKHAYTDRHALSVAPAKLEPTNPASEIK